MLFEDRCFVSVVLVYGWEWWSSWVRSSPSCAMGGGLFGDLKVQVGGFVLSIGSWTRRQQVFFRDSTLSSREGKILDLKRGQVLVTRAMVKLLQELSCVCFSSPASLLDSPLHTPGHTAPSTPLASGVGSSGLSGSSGVASWVLVALERVCRLYLGECILSRFIVGSTAEH